jgi:hypothetical protein
MVGSHYGGDSNGDQEDGFLVRVGPLSGGSRSRGLGLSVSSGVGPGKTQRTGDQGADDSGGGRE